VHKTERYYKSVISEFTDGRTSYLTFEADYFVIPAHVETRDLSYINYRSPVCEHNFCTSSQDCRSFAYCFQFITQRLFKGRFVHENSTLVGLYARILDTCRWDRQVVPERRLEITTARCVITQNSAVHVFFALICGGSLKACRFVNIQFIISRTGARGGAVS
jgi:hypothetical protein